MDINEIRSRIKSIVDPIHAHADQMEAIAQWVNYQINGCYMFENRERRRYYGLRIGDTVKLLHTRKEPAPQAEVIEYCVSDNNRVLVKLENGETTDWVAEWCEIITKIEDK